MEACIQVEKDFCKFIPCEIVIIAAKGNDAMKGGSTCSRTYIYRLEKDGRFMACKRRKLQYYMIKSKDPNHWTPREWGGFQSIQ